MARLHILHKLKSIKNNIFYQIIQKSLFRMVFWMIVHNTILGMSVIDVTRQTISYLVNGLDF